MIDLRSIEINYYFVVDDMAIKYRIRNIKNLNNWSIKKDNEYVKKARKNIANELDVDISDVHRIDYVAYMEFVDTGDYAPTLNDDEFYITRGEI